MTWSCLLSLHCICEQYGPILRLFSIPRCLLRIMLWQGRRLRSLQALGTSPNWLKIHPQKVFWLPIWLHTLMRPWHEWISEKFLLLPRHPQQQAASEYLKTFQNSRKKVRDSHDSNRSAQNSMYVNFVFFTLTKKMILCGWICLILQSRYFNLIITCYFLEGICRKI